MNTLGERLSKARKLKGLTQQEAANRLGVSNGTISGYERGYRDPDTDILTAMSNLYESSIDYLTGRTENPNRTLSDPSRALIDGVIAELTDEEIIDKIDFMVDGVKLDDASVKLFVALIRAQRAAKEQSAAVQAGGLKNL